MLHVYQSNRLEVLVTLLSKQLQLNPNPRVFEPETILVQSPGMSQWLKLEIAKENGIAANLSFPLPSSFIWRLYQNILQDVPEQSPFNKDRMTWKLCQILPDVIKEEDFSHISSYLNPVETSTRELQSAFDELRLFTLAEKIADVFDNYLMYRPNWLNHWQQGNDDLPDENADEHVRWQAVLWRALYSYTLENNLDISADSPLHRADMHQQLLLKLKEASGEQLKSCLPSRLFVFGISAMPKAQLETLLALSEHIDVDVMWLNPCSVYWGDIISEKTKARLSQAQQRILATNQEHKHEYFVTGNPLLANLGKVGRDYLEILHQHDIEFSDLFVDGVDKSTTALQCLQSDIFNLRFRQSQLPMTAKQLITNTGKTSWDVDDDSIRIHSCHNVTRELEVLQDQLLDWFEKDPDLQPKDILVMMPDINQYAPYIDSVFGHNKDREDEYIPYTIADRSGIEQHPVLRTFVDLLALPVSRFSVNEVLDVLEVPLVMRRFEFEAQDISLIKTWVGECHIKWAKNASHKKEWGLPEQDLNTWLYGMQRMLLGASTGKNDLWHEILGFTEIEGINTQIVGKLIEFLSVLSELTHALKQTYSLANWHNLLNQIVNRLFCSDESHPNSQSDELAILKIREGIQNLTLYETNADHKEKVGFLVVQRVLNAEFNDTGVTQRFLAGKMNFCTLMPMRSVPFKVIAILGLNEGDYPRRVDPIGFDLISRYQPRKGDRSRKLDDRYLFLEALMSVRNKLRLSFIGQSQKTNDDMVPSIILDEFIDYLQQSYIVDNLSQENDLLDQIVIKHKLQPFDPAYYQFESTSTPYFSYNNIWIGLFHSRNQNIVKRNQARLAETQNDQTSLRNDHENQSEGSKKYSEDRLVDRFDLAELMEFWRHPIRHFYRNVLDVKLEIRTTELDEFEVFQHDGLQRYQYSNELLNELLFGDSDDYVNHLRSGAYPANKWGKTLLEKYVETNSGIKTTIQRLSNSNSEALTFEQETINFEFKIGEKPQKVNLSVTKVNGGYFIIRNGRLRPVDQLIAWITHICINSADVNANSYLVTNEDKVMYLPALSYEDAQSYLNDWFHPYLLCDGDKKLLKWHIDPALSWLSSVNKGETSFMQQKSLEKEIQSDRFRRTLANDEYASKHLKVVSDFDDSFFELTQHLIQPLLDLAKVDKTDKLIKWLATSGGN